MPQAWLAISYGPRPRRTRLFIIKNIILNRQRINKIDYYKVGVFVRSLIRLWDLILLAVRFYSRSPLAWLWNGRSPLVWLWDFISKDINLIECHCEIWVPQDLLRPPGNSLRGSTAVSLKRDVMFAPSIWSSLKIFKLLLYLSSRNNINMQNRILCFYTGKQTRMPFFIEG